MTDLELFKNCVKRLDKYVNGHPCHESLRANRAAGAIEFFLLTKGFFKLGEKIEYMTGGKKYFPFLGDFRWIESYPHFMLRKAKEYLDKTN